jgi:hypothetical protein
MVMHVELLQTLGDPTRLQIVEILRSGEHSVNDIVEDVDIDPMGRSVSTRFAPIPLETSMPG